MTERTGKSHSAGGRRVEPLPRGARKHAFPPPAPLPTAARCHWPGARREADVRKRAAMGILENWLQLNMGKEGGGGWWPEQECKQRLHKS